jgi:hypothetical protein
MAPTFTEKPAKAGAAERVPIARTMALIAVFIFVFLGICASLQLRALCALTDKKLWAGSKNNGGMTNFPGRI